MGNKVAFMTIRRALQMLLKGTHVPMENLLMSIFWLLDEVKSLMGSLGMYLVRIDQCTFGTPFQKPQLWLTSNRELLGMDDRIQHDWLVRRQEILHHIRRSFATQLSIPSTDC